jgi:hypothetical protein
MSTRRELLTLLGGAVAAGRRAQQSSREKGVCENVLSCHKNDYRDAEAIGHRT